MLHLDDHWIWDFWLVADGPDHHVFFLHAPRSLGDPELRHRRARIGHAVSSDLRDWTVLPEALGPGPVGAWDDGAPWTGSIIRVGRHWELAYTGTSSGEDGLIQRIGIAVSDDLLHWERPIDQPVIAADHRWYERFDGHDWFDEAWRDPWLVADPDAGGFLALICARVADGPTDERGAIGLARSTDLRRWTVAPPVYAPGLFGQMEVPQAVPVGGRWYLLFCTGDSTHSARWARQRPTRTTTYYVIGESPTGPFTTEPQPLADDRALAGETHYAAKLHVLDDRLVYLATVFYDADGAFVGDLTDPWPVTVEQDGRLVIARP